MKVFQIFKFFKFEKPHSNFWRKKSSRKSQYSFHFLKIQVGSESSNSQIIIFSTVIKAFLVVYVSSATTLSSGISEKEV